MKVLMVEPGKHPRELELGHSLEAMYAALECDTITATYPWEDEVSLVTDDEGLLPTSCQTAISRSFGSSLKGISSSAASRKITFQTCRRI